MAKEISYEEAIVVVPVYGNASNDHTGCYQNKVDPAHLLQVIRDMNRRITDLERELQQWKNQKTL